MRTITIDILEEKAMSLLLNLEQLNLIKLRVDQAEPSLNPSQWQEFKGAMSQQPLEIVDQQLTQLRNEWE